MTPFAGALAVALARGEGATKVAARAAAGGSAAAAGAKIVAAPGSKVEATAIDDDAAKPATSFDTKSPQRAMKGARSPSGGLKLGLKCMVISNMKY